MWVDDDTWTLVVAVVTAARAVDAYEEFGRNDLCDNCRCAEPKEHDDTWTGLGVALAALDGRILDVTTAEPTGGG